MSLLLKALQNAAKNREAGAVGSEEATQVQREPASSELSLEPIDDKAAQAAARSESAYSSRDPAAMSASASDRSGSTSRTQAQNVLRAGATRQTAAGSSPGILDWFARRPLVMFSTAAGIFAIGYGVYLYLQLTNPGIFMARPNAPTPGPALTAPGSGPAVTPPPPSMNPAVAPPGPVVAAPGELTPSPSAVGTLPGPLPSRPDAPLSAGSPPAVPPSAAAQTPPPVDPRLPAAPPSVAGASPAAGSPAVPATAAPANRPALPPIAVTATTAREPAPAARPGGASRTAAPRQAPAPAMTATAPAAQNDLNSAYQALQKGELLDAERLYRQVIAADARNVDAMLGLASAQAQMNRADAATQLYMRVLEVDPRNSYAQAGLLNIGGRADPAAAESRLKQLIAREPSAFLYFTLGNLYAEQNQWASAQGAYFQAFNMAPDNPDYAFNLAVGLEHLSQPRLALDYYRRALSIAQARGNAQFALAPVQARVRSLEAALAERP